MNPVAHALAYLPATIILGCHQSDTLCMPPNLFRGQLTTVVVDAVRELAALDYLLPPPVKDATLVFGGVNRKPAPLRLCTTLSSKLIW